MQTFRWMVVASAVCLTACAPAISSSGGSITKLEQERAANPSSEPVLRSLGIAYFKANRFDDARTALRQAVSLDSNDGVAALYLGLTAEAQNDLAAARSAYESYLSVGKTRSVKSQITARLAVIARKETEASAKQAIAQERQLAAVPGPATTVAVMPFRFTGRDTSLKPLERGFADLVTTDLSRVSALKVLDREHLQAVLDEINLQQSAGAQTGGVRAGKILQAGSLVGGSISQIGTDRLNASAIVTNVQSTAQVGTGATDQQPLDQIFTLEKNLVLKLLIDNLKVVPTTAERNAIEQRPTRSLAAFLAYSRGLEAEDQGRFDDASRFYDNALRLDPGFGRAQQKSTETKNIVTGNAVTVSSVEAGLQGTSEGAAVAAATGATTTEGATNAAAAIADGLNPSVAGAATSGNTTAATPPTQDASSGTGADNPSTRTGRVTVIVRKP